MKNNKGFSLLELSIVMLIMGFLTVGIVNMAKITYQVAKQSDTKNKLRQIEKALNAYVIQNKKLPCPSGILLTLEDANYGKANCSENTSNGIKLVSEGKIFVGALPIDELNLDKTHLADGWNNKFIYLVTKNFTVENSLANKSTIENELINSKFSYAIISNGQNRIGGIGYNSKLQDNRFLNKATNDEKMNIYSNINTNNIKSFREEQGFDDLIVVKNKEVLLQELNLYDVGCMATSDLNDKITNICGSNYIISEINIGDYFNYKEQKQFNSSISNDNVKCVIECGYFGKINVFKQ